MPASCQSCVSPSRPQGKPQGAHYRPCPDQPQGNHTEVPSHKAGRSPLSAGSSVPIATTLSVYKGRELYEWGLATLSGSSPSSDSFGLHLAHIV